MRTITVLFYNFTARQVQFITRKVRNLFCIEWFHFKNCSSHFKMGFASGQFNKRCAVDVYNSTVVQSPIFWSVGMTQVVQFTATDQKVNSISPKLLPVFPSHSFLFLVALAIARCLSTNPNHMSRGQRGSRYTSWYFNDLFCGITILGLMGGVNTRPPQSFFVNFLLLGHCP